MALHLVSEKILRNSDIEPQQNRLLIPIPDVRCRLLPFLSLDERCDANLLDFTIKKRKKYDKKSSDADADVDGDRKIRKKMEIGQKHGGLEIGQKHGGLEVRMVANRESRGIGMTLTRWDGTLAAVLKGGAEWKGFVAKEGFCKDDIVQLFVFRRNVNEVIRRHDENTELCFMLCKKECEGNHIEQIDLSLSLTLPAYSALLQNDDLSLSLSLPAYSALLQNDPNLVSTSSHVIRLEDKLKEKVPKEDNLNLELTLQQPGQENNLNLELTLRQSGE